MEALLVGLLTLYLIFVSLSIAEDCCKVCSRTLEKLNQFYSEYREIVIALLVSGIISLLLWEPWKEIKQVTQWNNLGLNLFAGAIWTFFTIFILDKLAKRRDEKAKFSMLLVTYKSIRKPFFSLIDNWMGFLTDVEDGKYLDSISSPEQLFKEDIFNSIYNSQSDVFFYETDETSSISRFYQKIDNDLGKALSDHQSILQYYESDFYSDIYKFKDTDTNRIFKSSLDSLTKERIRQQGKPVKLGHILGYKRYSKEDFEALIRIYKWLDNFYKKHGEQYNLEIPYRLPYTWP